MPCVMREPWNLLQQVATPEMATTTTSQLRSFWAPAQPRRRPARPSSRKVVAAFDPAKRSDAFNTCYRGVVVGEAEWPAFIRCLQAPLPTTFSFVTTGSGEVHPTLVQRRFEDLVARVGEPHAAAGEAVPDPEGVVVVPAGARVVLRLQCGRGGRGVGAFLRLESSEVARRARPRCERAPRADQGARGGRSARTAPPPRPRATAPRVRAPLTAAQAARAAARARAAACARASSVSRAARSSGSLSIAEAACAAARRLARGRRRYTCTTMLIRYIYACSRYASHAACAITHTSISAALQVLLLLCVYI